MLVTTGEEARALDTYVMKKIGISESVLMENAGKAVIELTKDMVPWKDAKVVVVCGSGNNGGDGFVAARYAKLEGAHVTVLFMGDANHMGDNARLYSRKVRELHIPIVPVREVDHEAINDLQDADIIVDALFGTGLRRPVEGEKAKLIAAVNDCQRAVRIAVDIPSGISADTGEVLVTPNDKEDVIQAVRADYTVTFLSMKRGTLLGAGKEYSGHVLFSSIGVPEPLFGGSGSDSVVSEAGADTQRNRITTCPRFVDASMARKFLFPRKWNAHKGSNGHIGILAGSAGMEGAALLAAQGALYGGAGKVTLFVPKKVAERIAGRIPEVMVCGVGDGEYVTEKETALLEKELEVCDVLAMGPGLGRNKTTMALVETLLKETKAKAVIVDADALYALENSAVALENRFILTPHVGEFSRLTGKAVQLVERERIDGTLTYAKEKGVTLLLKGAPTVIATPTGETYLNSTGNAGMASGGMGDTLTGLIAALAGQMETDGDVVHVPISGAYIHGLAGDIAKEDIGIGFTASDVAKRIPKARKMVMGNEE